jgi:RNA polymerase sigma factor (sigma-70 family)
MSMNVPTTFTELIARVRAGDEAAAADLVREYEPLVRRGLRLRLRDARFRLQLDSMDIVQSVMARFFVHLMAGQYDLQDPTDLTKLLSTMASNKLAERVRHEQSQLRDRRRTVGAVDEMSLAGRDDSPSQIAMGRELMSAIQSRLTEEERRLLELRKLGHDWSEIVAACGGTVEGRRKQLARALDRVLAELGVEV